MSDQPPQQRQDIDVTYTFDWYRDFLERFQQADVTFRSFDTTDDTGSVLLRHDVDLLPPCALDVARIEAARDITATYFFQLTSPLYNPLQDSTRELIRDISSLGHDVGLHFSTHQYWDVDDPPPERELVDRVRRELEILAHVVDPVAIVSFHIPPSWVVSRRFEEFTSTYEPRFIEEIDYVADSNQRWRDRPPLQHGIPDALQVLTHPGLWGETDASFRQRVQHAAARAHEQTTTYVTSRFIDRNFG